MLFRALYAACVALLLSFHATGAVIGTRSIQSAEPRNTFQTAITTIWNLPLIHNELSIAAASDPSDVSHGGQDRMSESHETTLDWREDRLLRQLAEREAGFFSGSSYDAHPVTASGPLFKICIFSAIAICILKIARDRSR